MGSPNEDNMAGSNEVQHEVALSGFAVSMTEVSQSQYMAAMGSFPDEGCLSEMVKGDDLPMVCVSWVDSVRYANRLSEIEDLPAAYTINGSEVSRIKGATGYRLLTEAEWEYAARAGTTTRFVGTDVVEEVCGFSNIRDCPDLERGPVSVSSAFSNGWGLKGFGGNVWEWVWDGYAPYQLEMTTNPTVDTGSDRVIRGGSWGYSARVARVAFRTGSVPGSRFDFLGFRVARSLPSSL